MDAGELLIATYLPGAIPREEIRGLDVDEFIRYCSQAIYARSMRRDDIKAAIMEAAGDLFAN